jgi:hypothetical protein
LAKKKFERIIKYKCTITGEEFKMSTEAPKPSELMSLRAYYEMHGEEDDRPEHIKKQISLTPMYEEAEEESEEVEEA